MDDKLIGTGLLDAVRHLLMEELLDALPEDRKYQARMAARAIAIAAREARAGDGDLHREHELLTQLYGEAALEATGSGIAEQVAGINRRFAKDIRAGAFDGACAHGVRALLEEIVRAKLRVSNPKYLESFDR